MADKDMAAWKFDKELGNKSLNYRVDDVVYYKDHNEKSFDTIRELLDRVGVNLDKDGDRLSISINPRKYFVAARTYAGRYRSLAYRKDEFIPYTYSDIIYMLNTMSNDEVAAKINMPIATFYRHKKRMVNSDYYKTLDPSRFNDIEYLKSFNSDNAF